MELPKDWDPVKAGAALRPVLAEVLDEMPEEDRATFADDESLLALAVMTCFQEAASIAEAWADTHQVDDADTLLKGVLQDDLFVRISVRGLKLFWALRPMLPKLRRPNHESI